MSGPDQWSQIKLPAIAQQHERFDFGDESYERNAGEPLQAEREPIRVLEKIRDQLGPEAFAAQYLQDPVPPGGNMIKREWVRHYDELPARTPSTRVIQSWDTASIAGGTGSYSVCTTWFVTEGRYYLAHVLRGRFDYPTLEEQAISLANQSRPTITLVEQSGIGPALGSKLQGRGFAVELVRVEQNKQTRMSVQSGKFADGQVHLPKEASWLGELEAELFAFPGSQYTDQIDSISQALGYRIDTCEWTKQSLDRMAEFTEALAFDAWFGRLTGRPW